MRAPKKVRRQEDEPPDDGGDEEMADERRQAPFSFKDAVLNTGMQSPEVESDWEVDDLELHVDDVMKVVVEGVLTIDF